MSAFEDKIKRNKDFFNHRDPDPGHQERFAEQLENSMPAQRSSFSGWLVIKAAATLLILLSVSYAAFYFAIGSRASSESNVHQIVYTDEFGEVLAYYDAVSVEKIEELDRLVSNDEQAEKFKQTAINRLDDLDMSLAAIEKEYQKNPENKTLQAAMINNKRKKVEVMDRIITQLDYANTELY